MKKLVVFIMLLFVTISVNAQEIQWISFEDLKLKMDIQPKKVLVYIHANWCKYCLIQENKTFSDSSVVDYLNREYYCLKLNAESTDSIVFLGKTYFGNKNTNHELAKLLGTKNGQLLFPTTVFLSNQIQPVSIWQGLLKPEDITVTN